MRSRLSRLTPALLVLAGCASQPTLEPELEPESEPILRAPTAPQVVVATKPAEAPAAAPTGLRFTAPDGWVREKPKNRMRKAQFRVPRAEGDPADASVVVYHFGGGGGGVDANVDRWAGQFTQDDGGSTRERAVIEERSVGGRKATLVDMSGRYVAETSPGSGERVDRADYRMLAAIVESEHGSYFVKFVGPRATVAKWADAFDAYVDSAH